MLTRYGTSQTPEALGDIETLIGTCGAVRALKAELIRGEQRRLERFKLKIVSPTPAARRSGSAQRCRVCVRWPNRCGPVLVSSSDLVRIELGSAREGQPGYAARWAAAGVSALLRDGSSRPRLGRARARLRSRKALAASPSGAR